MLVLTRKIGERIVIDHSIVIEILETQSTRIKVGIQAPPQVKIVRQELLTRDNSKEPGDTR